MSLSSHATRRNADLAKTTTTGTTTIENTSKAPNMHQQGLAQGHHIARIAYMDTRKTTEMNKC